MKALRFVMVTLFALCCISVASKSRAQGWAPGDYGLQAYIEQVASGTSSSYTISWGGNHGAGCSSSASGTTSATGWGAANFYLTYTYMGTPPTINLTVTAFGTLTGNTSILGCGGSASAASYVDTDSAGALYNYQVTPPNYAPGPVYGIETTFTTPASPYTLYITGSAYSTYSGDAMAESTSWVGFN